MKTNRNFVKIILVVILALFGITVVIHTKTQMLYDRILVNKEHVLPYNFVPQRLITINEPMGEKVDKTYQNKLVPHVYKAFKEMQKSASEQGYEIFVDSSFRPAEYQDRVFNNSANKNGTEHATKYVAKPGASEHQTGLAIDIIFRRNNEMIEPFDGMENEPEIRWLFAHAHEYGFILRYPRNQDNDDFNVITGFKFEPWHFRYIGKKSANEIFTKNITLEEYYDMNSNFLDALLMRVMHLWYR